MLRRVSGITAILLTVTSAFLLANHKSVFHQDDWVWESIVSGDGSLQREAELAFEESWRAENAFLAKHRVRETHHVVVGATDFGTERILEGEVLVGYIIRQEVDVYGSNYDELLAYNRDNQVNSKWVWSTYPRGVPTIVDFLTVAWLALVSFSVGSFQRARFEYADRGMSYVVVVAHLALIAVAIVLSCYFMERHFWQVAVIFNACTASITTHWLVVTRKSWARAGLRSVPYLVASGALFFFVEAASALLEARAA